MTSLVMASMLRGRGVTGSADLPLMTAVGEVGLLGDEAALSSAEPPATASVLIHSWAFRYPRCGFTRWDSTRRGGWSRRFAKIVWPNHSRVHCQIPGDLPAVSNGSL